MKTDEPIVLHRKPLKKGVNPFTLEEVPLSFSAKGCLIPEWKIDEYGLCGILPYEDAKTSARVDEITLIPMGAARLRISAFPPGTK